MLFSSPKMAPIYLAIRVYLGWQWLHNGMFKVIDPAWTQTGIKLQTTWATDTALRAGQKGALIHYGWYHAFLTYMLQNHWYVWFGNPRRKRRERLLRTIGTATQAEELGHPPKAKLESQC